MGEVCSRQHSSRVTMSRESPKPHDSVQSISLHGERDCGQSLASEKLSPDSIGRWFRKEFIEGGVEATSKIKNVKRVRHNFFRMRMNVIGLILAQDQGVTPGAQVQNEIA